MAAPEGNKNSLGNSGGKPGRSGRKSYAREKADYELLERIFFEKYSKEEIKQLAKNQCSVLDVFRYKGLSGNEKVILAIFNKLFPDQGNLRLNLVKPLPTDIADSRLKELYGGDHIRKK